MGLFFDVLSAINNPQQAANVEQLGGLTQELQQVAGKFGLNAQGTQTALSALSSQLRPALQQQAQGGSLDLGSLAGQVMGAASGGKLGALSSLLPPEAQSAVLQSVAGKTGLNPSQLEGLIPSLLPIVMKFFNLGASGPGGFTQNPLLKQFLDSDRDGDVDLGDVFKFAGRFLNGPGPV
jgi:hypothetical protein